MDSPAVTFLGRVDRIVNAVMRWVAMSLLLVLCTTMALQVFQRFVVGRSLDWPDELAPTLLAWIGFVGAALAAREDEHVGFPLLVDALPPAVAAVVRSMGTLVVVALPSVYVWFSVPLIARTWGQTLTTVEISRGLLYLVLPVTSVVMIGYAAAGAASYWRKRCRPAPAPAPDGAARAQARRNEA